jgi:antitoxin HigA-1
MTRQPTHPGAILKDVIIELNVQNISTTQFARDLRISRNKLYKITNEDNPVTPNIAIIRLGKVLGNGSGIWLRLQQAHDLWNAENELGDELNEIPVYKVA